jgi:hypothetical protein
MGPSPQDRGQESYPGDRGRPTRAALASPASTTVAGRRLTRIVFVARDPMLDSGSGRGCRRADHRSVPVGPPGRPLLGGAVHRAVVAVRRADARSGALS